MVVRLIVNNRRSSRVYQRKKGRREDGRTERRREAERERERNTVFMDFRFENRSKVTCYVIIIDPRSTICNLEI